MAPLGQTIAASARTVFTSLAILALLLFGSVAWGLPTQPYFPLADQNLWSYRVNGTPGHTRTVMPGTTLVNDVPTKALVHSSGYIQYLTNDGEGIRIHGEYDPADSATMTLSPPLKLADADAQPGALVSGIGTATVVFPTLGSFALSYEASSTVEAIEVVTVRAGSFNAVRLQLSLRTYGDILGTPFDSTTTQTIWVAENIGIVKEISSADGQQDILELEELSFQPVLTFSSTAFAWPSQPANGLPGWLYGGLMVSNSSSASIQIAGVTVSGEFGLPSNTCTGTLPPGAGCSIQVDFRPSSPGTQTGILTVHSDARGSPFLYGLSGTGMPVGKLSVSPDSLDFGGQDRGTSSAAQSVTLSNTGTASFSIGWINASGDFSRTSDCGASLAAGASCTIQVSFTPSSAGTRTGVLAIGTDILLGGTVSIPLTGLGVGAAPTLDIAPVSLNFGAQALFSSSAPQTITLTNAGTDPLFVLDIGWMIPPSEFAYSTDCASPLLGGTSCFISVTFTPGSAGDRYAYLNIVSDASNGNRLLSLTGFGNDGSDTTPPPAPTGLTATAVDSSRIDLSWVDTTDNGDVAQYKIYRGGTLIAQPIVVGAGVACIAVYPPACMLRGRNYGFSDVSLTLTPLTTYSYTVIACDAAGNCSGPGTAASATTPAPPDAQAPSVPAGLTGMAVSTTQIDLSWTASTDNVGVTAYKVYRDGVLLTTIGNVTSYSSTGLTASTSYTYTVAACDAAGNCSAQSTSASATSFVPDTTAPTAPNGLAASTVSSSQIDLSWGAASDNVGVTAYRVYRDGVLVRTLGNVTNYSNSGLAASKTYSYTVVACDTAGNCSDPSVAASATTAPAVAGSTAFSPAMLAKWNLMGNTGTVALDVATFIGTQDAPVDGVTQYVLSVWKWVVNPSTGAGKWAFFTPSLTKDESDAAALAQGYDALSTINPGEGFWVNRTNPPGLNVPVTLSGPASVPFYYDAVNFAELKKNAWHLIATDSPVLPSVFNESDVNPNPPSPGTIPTGNFQTLWAWSASAQNWFFYATSIEADGYTSATGTDYTGLDAVRHAAFDAGFLDFYAATPEPKTLGTGIGFWVRR